MRNSQGAQFPIRSKRVCGTQTLSENRYAILLSREISFVMMTPVKRQFVFWRVLFAWDDKDAANA